MSKIKEMLGRERFDKFEEIILYLMGISLFLKYDYIKIFVPIVILILILRKVLFNEPLNCGNENIKKFIIFFIVFGIIWNFFGGMSYKPARSFIKMSRFIPFIFFMYPIFEKNKKYLDRFIICSLGSYSILLYKVIEQYKVMKGARVTGFEGISVTGDIGAMVAVFSLGLFFYEKNIIKKVIYILVYISGIFITVATQGRAPLLSIAVATVLILLINIILKFNIKKMIISILILGFISAIGIRYIPQNRINRFKTTFDTQKTNGNTSNGLRIEMWKIAVKRIKEKPILGYGTKFDKNESFRKFASQLPEETDADRNYKHQLLNNGFNDAHNMYLNAVVDNGLFVISLLIIWFFIPIYLVFKYMKDSENKEYFLASIASLISFLVIGAFWMMWRMDEQVYFWIFYVIMLYSAFNTSTKMGRD